MGTVCHVSVASECSLICRSEPVYQGDRGPGEVQIGDVGFVNQDDGAFYRLFHARHSDEHPWNQEGVPVNHEPILLDNGYIQHIRRNINCGPHASDSTLEMAGRLAAGS